MIRWLSAVSSEIFCRGSIALISLMFSLDPCLLSKACSSLVYAVLAIILAAHFLIIPAPLDLY